MKASPYRFNYMYQEFLNYHFRTLIDDNNVQKQKILELEKILK